jgi:hypothetical protein
MAEMNPLRRRMIEDMQVRNLSPVTQRCYVHAVAKFAQHFNRSPDRLGLEEIRAYQIHLTATGISWAGFNVAVCALRFFYGITLGRAAMVERIPYARKRRQLPVIFALVVADGWSRSAPSRAHHRRVLRPGTIAHDHCTLAYNPRVSGPGCHGDSELLRRERLPCAGSGAHVVLLPFARRRQPAVRQVHRCRPPIHRIPHLPV